MASPKRMNFRKSSKRPLHPPLLFGKSCCKFVSMACSKSPVSRSKICKIYFWIKNDPPLWTFSENSSILVTATVPDSEVRANYPKLNYIKSMLRPGETKYFFQERQENGGKLSRARLVSKFPVLPEKVLYIFETLKFTCCRNCCQDLFSSLWTCR